MQSLKFYDFFAGVGLVELALAPQWECVWANDIDPSKAAIYQANHNPSTLHVGDIASIHAIDLPQDAQMAWASFPCQDLSLAGWGRGMTAERSGTFWQFYRVMSEMTKLEHRPPMIVLENVVGLLKGPDFVSLCDALDSLNMQFGALVIDAVRFLPQSRPRVFVVAVDRDIDCGQWISPTAVESWTPPGLLRAHAGLPKQLSRRWRWWKLPSPTAASVPVDSLVEENPNGVKWHTPLETDRLLQMMSATNLQKVQQRIAASGRSVGFLYKRTRGGQQRAEVRFDGIAGCLRTPTGGSSRQTIVVVEDGVVRTRLISPREAARLMGVKDDFWLPGSYNDAYHAMGDGVAVAAVQWLAEHLLTPLGAACQAWEGKEPSRALRRRSPVAQLALAEEMAAWR